ncbi:MAG: M23 family metallopeptidase [Promethearchaeota archaeon]|jgi:hypothetical protein
MPKFGFYDIVQMDDLHVSIPRTSHFTIGTSPYYAHQHGLAIDIYHSLSIRNYEILSPVSGKISKIKSLIAPKPKFTGGTNRDYLILIENTLNSEIVWKLMHVKPNVKVGDRIEIGDPLGNTIRNGYFAYWSSPHLHLEIRNSTDAIRARGGKNFSLAIESRENFEESSEIGEFKRIPVEIQSICHEFILCRLPKLFYHKISPIYGFKVKTNQMDCILDGGIPHYKIGTIISSQELNSDYPIYLGTEKIGTTNEVNKQFGFLKFEPVKFFLNDIEIRGISLYLASFYPLIKIIPYSKNDFSLKTKSIQYLSIV